MHLRDCSLLLKTFFSVFLGNMVAFLSLYEGDLDYLVTIRFFTCIYLFHPSGHKIFSQHSNAILLWFYSIIPSPNTVLLDSVSVDGFQYLLLVVCISFVFSLRYGDYFLHVITLWSRCLLRLSILYESHFVLLDCTCTSLVLVSLPHIR